MPTKRLFAALPLFTLAALAACVPPPAPAPAPAPAPPPAPAPQPVTPPPAPTYSHWSDAPQTPGNWFYIPQQGASIAAFGPAQRQPLFALRCNLATHMISIGRTSASTVDQPMTIHTESANRTFSASPAQGSVEHLVAASVPASDSFLDAMAFSKGRFAVEVSGEPTLYLPSWPEITRLIEDCR